MWLRVALAMMVFWMAGCSTLAKQHCITAKPRHVLRVATYNTFCADGNRQSHQILINIIRKSNPDIMLFQESQCISSKILKCHLKQYRYQLFTHYCDGILEHDDGLGIISKYPIVKSYFYPPVYGWSPAWLFIVKTPKGLVQVFNVHLHPKMISDSNIGIFAEGLWMTPYCRRKEISCCYHALDPKLPTIIAGDFNEGDDGAAAGYLRAHSFVDCLLSLPSYIKTWHWDFKFFTLSARYDRIYCSKNWCFLRCQVLHEGTSDHYPVFADFYLK